MRDKSWFYCSVVAGYFALCFPVFATFEVGSYVVSTDSNKVLKGAISDYLFYTIGGGTVISQPPSHSNMQKLSIGLGWNSDLMCGNFDINTTVKNQLNGVTRGFKDMMSNVINSATGAVASLPAMIIQRANPGLYELLTNGVLQASVSFDKAQLNCQKMSQKMADYAYSNQWTQSAIGEEFKRVVANTSDAVSADNQLKTSTGKEGIRWIGGKKRGGIGQPAIKPTYDLAKAGFNILNKQPITSDHPVIESACKGALCRRYKTSEEAAKAVVSVLGDRAIRTCSETRECHSGGEENKSGTSTIGVGFSPMLEETTQENMALLIKLVNGHLKPNSINLAQLKTGDLAVSRGVIQALKEDPDNVALIQRLAGELAMSDTIATAFGMRRMLIAGQAEPHVAEHKIALEETDRRLAFLDREILALKNEMEIRKAISNNTLLMVLSRQESRDAENSVHQPIIQSDKAIHQLNQKVDH
ncbi:integrating conjugative element protein [Proteus mirabilis]|nr:integrating conjugative element protein [Proteus mirabilis]